MSSGPRQCLPREVLVLMCLLPCIVLVSHLSFSKGKKQLSGIEVEQTRSVNVPYSCLTGHWDLMKKVWSTNK